MKTHLHIFAGLLALLLAPAYVNAAVLMEDNFESYAIGTTPTNPGDGNPNNWFFTNLATDDVVAGGPSGGTQMLHVQQATPNTSSFGREFAAQDGATSSDLTLTLSFDLKLNSKTTSDYYITFLDSSLTSLNNPINIRITNGGIQALTRATSPGVGTAVNVKPSQNSTLSLNTWYEFTITADLSTKTYRLDVTNLSNSTIGSTGDLYFYQNIQTLDELLFRNVTTSNTGVDWNIDNVSLTSVPEPNTAFLLIGAGIACLIRRRGEIHAKSGIILAAREHRS